MAVMYARGSFSWLTFDVLPHAPTILGGPLFIVGRASVDAAADLLTVTTPAGQREATQIGGAEIIGLARRLLRELHRQPVD